MESVLFWLAILTLLVHLAAALDATRGTLSVRFLRDISPEPLGDEDKASGVIGGAPRVSIVVAARNEERNLEEALRSLLRLDYPDLEIIVVDDRSDDRTPEIVARLEADEPRLRSVRVEELPGGWLGKNHALQRGAEAASGELLLFTDADVVMHPSVLTRAVRHLRREGLDHLASTFDIRCSGAMMEAFVGAFSIFFSLYFRPWKARDPDSGRYIGIGGFNLVRAAAYRAVGGHARIALRPDDDVKLGKLIKRAGYRQDLVFGKGLIEVEWYASIGEAIDGLMKNNFSGVDYRLSVVGVASVAQLLFDVWPYAALFLTSGTTRWLNVAIVGLLSAGWILACRGNNVRWRGAVLFPLACLLSVYILWRSTVLTLWRGGIEWRGTFYDLDDLRANKV